MVKLFILLALLISFFYPAMTEAETTQYKSLISRRDIILDYSNAEFDAGGSVLEWVAKRNTFPLLSLAFGGKEKYKEAILEHYLRSSPDFSGKSTRLTLQIAAKSYLSFGFAWDRSTYTIHHTTLATGTLLDPAEEELLALYSLFHPELGKNFYNGYRSVAFIPASISLRPDYSMGLLTTIHLSPILGGVTAFRCCGEAGLEPYVTFEFGLGHLASGRLDRLDLSPGIRIFPEPGIFLQMEGFIREGLHSRYGASTSDSSGSDSSSSDSSETKSTEANRRLHVRGIRFGAGVLL